MRKWGSQAKYKALNKAAGRCVTCGRKRDRSKVYCNKHLNQANDWQRAWQERRKMNEQYDEDYFLRGKETGKSLYENYRWLPELTIPMACTIAKHLGLKTFDDKILDYGCARGYLVKALRGMGYQAWGYDISQWAYENCDNEIKEYITKYTDVAYALKPDWIIAKDVLEHIQYINLKIRDLMTVANKGVFVVVPLAAFDSGMPYIIEEYEKDITHCQRKTLLGWAEMFVRPGWRVEVAYRIPGIKDNYAQYPKGNGFITARRIEDNV